MSSAPCVVEASRVLSMALNKENRENATASSENRDARRAASDSGSETVAPPDEFIERHGGTFSMEEVSTKSVADHSEKSGAEEADSFFLTPYEEYELKLSECAYKILSTSSSHSSVNIEQCATEEVKQVARMPEATYWRDTNPMPLFDDNIRFDAEEHKYTVLNPHTNEWEVSDGSATALIDKCTKKKFDALEQSERIAKSNRTFGRYAHKSAEEIREMWDFGAECGTAFHLCAEYVLNYTTQLPPRIALSPIMKTYEMNLFAKFVLAEIVGKFEVFRTELCMADWAKTREDTTAAYRLLPDDETGEPSPYHQRDPIMRQLLCAVKLAGMADAVVRRKDAPPNVIQIWDWKRAMNAEKDTSYDGSYYKFPCDTLQDCKRNKFSVQTNTYKWFIEQTTDLVVERMCVCVFHPENQEYKMIDVPDLQHMTQRLMRMRLKDNLRKAEAKDDAESKRYASEIREYFSRAPSDPRDMWDQVQVKRKHETIE